MKAKISTVVHGHVKISDKITGEVLLDHDNAIHPENMARVIARGLANESNHQIYKIALGNGGTHIDSTNNIAYEPPITTGTAATLYSKTYEEVVDESAGGAGAGNSVTSASGGVDLTSTVTCSITLDPTEPVGQANNDGTTVNPDSTFTFDELGLMTSDTTPLLLSHIIFSPIEKSSNRQLMITYTLTISVS